MSTRHVPPEAKRSPGLKAWLGLAIILGPVLLVAMDNSILYLAMPRITDALTPSADQSLWILDVYGFAVGSLLVAFGTIGDRYGRLKLLLIGVLSFGLASAGAAFATSAWMLITFRALMGIAGATLLPSALAVLSELFPDARHRAQAIGIFASAFAAGFAIGPIVGGQLLSHFWWGSVFLVNLPVVAVFPALAPILLGEVKETRPGRVDVVSVVLAVVGLLLAVYAVTTTAAEGAAAVPAALGAVGVVTMVAFARRQRRLEYPLIDFGLFRDRVFTVAVITGLLPLAAWSATAYLSGVYLQTVLDMSVLQAAALAVPGALVLTVTCIVTPMVVGRVGTRPALIACHFAIAAGMSLFLMTGATGGAGWYAAAMVVAGLGYGISFAVVADVAVAAVPSERAGSAAAMAETSNEIGNALGIALLGSLAALIFRLMGPDLAPTLNETAELPGVGAAALAEAESAFVTGLHVVVVVAGLLHAGLGVLALRWLPASAPAPEEEGNGGSPAGALDDAVGAR
ncbi:MFS transporter [Nocardiopsis halophila]|uniref:MFS transporter n=1 Tax=Nocardiopsis halophila TaxID=141692 RepID=UPI000688B309|nr:MFS transporter [Nocardiopsis halophila]